MSLEWWACWAPVAVWALEVVKNTLPFPGIEPRVFLVSQCVRRYSRIRLSSRVFCLVTAVKSILVASYRFHYRVTLRDEL